jgi:hypothetical protein
VSLMVSSFLLGLAVGMGLDSDTRPKAGDAKQGSTRE